MKFYFTITALLSLFPPVVLGVPCKLCSNCDATLPIGMIPLDLDVMITKWGTNRQLRRNLQQMFQGDDQMVSTSPTIETNQGASLASRGLVGAMAVLVLLVGGGFMVQCMRKYEREEVYEGNEENEFGLDIDSPPCSSDSVDGSNNIYQPAYWDGCDKRS